MISGKDHYQPRERNSSPFNSSFSPQAGSLTCLEKGAGGRVSLSNLVKSSENCRTINIYSFNKIFMTAVIQFEIYVQIIKN